MYILFVSVGCCVYCVYCCGFGWFVCLCQVLAYWIALWLCFGGSRFWATCLLLVACSFWCIRVVFVVLFCCRCTSYIAGWVGFAVVCCVVMFATCGVLLTMVARILLFLDVCNYGGSGGFY